jgi:hypothetical protein
MRLRKAFRCEFSIELKDQPFVANIIGAYFSHKAVTDAEEIECGLDTKADE